MSSTTDATTRDEKRAALLASIRLLVFPILSGFALAFSYPPQGFRFLAWVALVPLGLALRDRRNWPELYVGLYLGGLAFHLIHLDWIRSGTGATWLSGPRATQWLAQGTLLALAWPLALGAGRLFIHRSRLPTTLALPLVWTAFEYARRYYWAIFDATGYPYGQLALTQAHHAWLIQIADITGAAWRDGGDCGRKWPRDRLHPLGSSARSFAEPATPCISGRRRHDAYRSLVVRSVAVVAAGSARWPDRVLDAVAHRAYERPGRRGAESRLGRRNKRTRSRAGRA